MDNSEDQNYITVQVKGQDEDTVCFRIGKELKLEKLFKSYCEKKQVYLHSMQFFYKGNRIHPRQTVLQARLKAGSEIDAIMHQSGGSSPGC
ncbi:hypothetical protein MLD38_038858 [Melastoma candidum]|uniref:Uncharacterized protein n=1 Tax=Melastoma candidum TaxID=119954 RepID=A0ACB9L0X9_9MYRT|nr:hypothetical protein MLD38_038858 [Melastoma candidum]